MLIVENNKIFLTRGDDAEIEVGPLTLVDGSTYELQEGDTLTLTVRETPTEEAAALVQITSVPGSNRIIIQHEDTSDLDYGQYSADVQLLTSDKKRRTVWPEMDTGKKPDGKNLKNFMIMPEVTML